MRNDFLCQKIWKWNNNNTDNNNMILVLHECVQLVRQWGTTIGLYLRCSQHITRYTIDGTQWGSPQHDSLYCAGSSDFFSFQISTKRVIVASVSLAVADLVLAWCWSSFVHRQNIMELVEIHSFVCILRFCPKPMSCSSLPSSFGHSLTLKDFTLFFASSSLPLHAIVNSSEVHRIKHSKSAVWENTPAEPWVRIQLQPSYLLWSIGPGLKKHSFRLKSNFPMILNRRYMESTVFSVALNVFL